MHPAIVFDGGDKDDLVIKADGVGKDCRRYLQDQQV